MTTLLSSKDLQSFMEGAGGELRGRESPGEALHNNIWTSERVRIKEQEREGGETLYLVLFCGNNRQIEISLF